MANLQPKGDLAAAQIAFYGIAFILSIPLILRHGFARKAGWLYITLLAILRIIGASCILYSEINQDYSHAILECAAITGAIGTAPLLMALSGIEERVNSTMEPRGVKQLVFDIAGLVSIVALALSIVGGVKISKTSGSSTGEDCLEASSILFLAIFIVLACVAIYNIAQLGRVPQSERRLLWAAAFSVPFMLVRVVFYVCVGFSGPGSTFYLLDINVWVESFMMFLMEVIIVSLFVAAGLLSPKLEPRTDDETKFNTANYPVQTRPRMAVVQPQQENVHTV